MLNSLTDTCHACYKAIPKGAYMCACCEEDFLLDDYDTAHDYDSACWCCSECGKPEVDVGPLREIKGLGLACGRCQQAHAHRILVKAFADIPRD